jgi:hypothetical protein
MQTAIEMENNSGFHGYSASAIYPGWAAHSSAQETKPEPAEEQLTASVDQLPMNAPTDQKSVTSIWFIVGVIILLVILFGMGG